MVFISLDSISASVSTPIPCSPINLQSSLLPPNFSKVFIIYFFLIKVNIFVLEYLENIENKIKTLKISISNQENPTESYLKDVGRTGEEYIEIHANKRKKQLLITEKKIILYTM